MKKQITHISVLQTSKIMLPLNVLMEARTAIDHAVKHNQQQQSFREFHIG